MTQIPQAPQPPAAPAAPPRPAPSPPPATAPVIPTGYRQGIITAITVLLGFTLAFWRFWGLETPGRWSLRAIFTAAVLLAAVALQITALFRALRIEDDVVSEYRKTVRWFVASAILLMLGLAAAVVESALAE